MIRPTPYSPGGLPKAWWLPGALGPLAVLQASKDGLRIIRPSMRARALQGLVVVAVGGTILFGVFVPAAFLIIRGLGLSLGSAILGYLVAGLLSITAALVLSPHTRKFFASDPHAPFLAIRVLSVNLGRFRQELEIEGQGYVVSVWTHARPATITAALRLAHQMLP